MHNTVTGQWRSQIRGAVSICKRPPEVEDRAIPGYWEGELLLGRHWTQVATVVERSIRYTVWVQLDNREMATVTEGLTRTMTRLPQHLRTSPRRRCSLCVGKIANSSWLSALTGFRV